MPATPTLPPDTLAPADGPLPRAGPAGDRYALGDEIARGGMGVVLAARDTHLQRDVAVKVLRPEYRTRPAAVRRFLDEGHVTGQLQHPGVPPVHDLGTLPDGSPFLAMKLIRGRTLADLFAARTGDGSERSRLLAVVEQVAQTLAYAHSKGVLHRDLKPGNVMVGAFGEVQVMDWGLAKLLASGGREPTADDAVATPDDPHRTAAFDPPSALELPDSDDKTQAGSMLGTPAYMPPEQAAGQLDRIDRRADVFAVGAVLCELLTGKPPYVGDTSERTKALALLGQLGPAYDRLAGCGADPELVSLCRRCLSADPGDRPADAQAVADALTAHRAGVEAKLRAAEVSAAEQRVRRRLRTRLAAAVMLTLAVGGLAAGWQWRRADAALRRVAAEEEKVRQALGDTEAERERVAAALAAEEAARARILDGLIGWLLRFVESADTSDDRGRAVTRHELDAIDQLWLQAAGPADLAVPPIRRFDRARLRAQILNDLGDGRGAILECKRAVQLWQSLPPGGGSESPAVLRSYSASLEMLGRTLQSWAGPPIARFAKLVPYDQSVPVTPIASVDRELNIGEQLAAVAGGAVAAADAGRPTPARVGSAQAAVASPAAAASALGLAEGVEAADTAERVLIDCLSIRKQLYASTTASTDLHRVVDVLQELSVRGDWAPVDQGRWVDAEISMRNTLTQHPDASKYNWDELVRCHLRRSRVFHPLGSLFSLHAAREAISRQRHRYGESATKLSRHYLAEREAEVRLVLRDHRRTAAAAVEFATGKHSDDQERVQAAGWLCHCVTLAGGQVGIEPALSYIRQAVHLLERAAEQRSDAVVRGFLAHRAFDPIRNAPEFCQLVARYAPAERAPPPRPAR